MDTDHIQLGRFLRADRWLNPHKGIDLPISACQAQILGVEPRGALALIQLFLTEPSLLRMPRKSGGIYPQKIRVIVPWNKRGQFDIIALNRGQIVIVSVV